MPRAATAFLIKERWDNAIQMALVYPRVAILEFNLETGSFFLTHDSSIRYPYARTSVVEVFFVLSRSDESPFVFRTREATEQETCLLTASSAHLKLE